MKRRTFLKTVGGAAGAAALGGCSTSSGSKGPGRLGKRKRGPANTYQLLPVDPSMPPAPPFGLKVRPAGWFPDGADGPGGGAVQRLFADEVVGRNKNKEALAFGVEFEPGPSKKWILGGPIPNVPSEPLSELIKALALRVRQYNASLYRLRRLHFYHHYKVGWPGPPPAKWPPRNPCGDPKDPLPDPSSRKFNQLAGEAEVDWGKVTHLLDQDLEDAEDPGYPKDDPKIILRAADMIAVNGYIVSMRVVVRKKGEGGNRGRQLGGSSSHVSLESPFSSSPNP